MRKHLIALGLLLILVCAAFCYANNGKEQAKITATETKTGDIEVTAMGNKMPPYKPGLKISLNRMPCINSENFPTGIGAVPEKPEERKAWERRIRDTLESCASLIITHIYDSLGIRLHILRPVIYFDDLKLAETTTDSLGRCIFRNVPIGYYQVVNVNTYFTEINRPEKDSSASSLELSDTTMKKPVPIPDRRDTYRPSTLYHGQVDFIRVAPDSISIVAVGTLDGPVNDDMGPWAISWEAHYKERGK